MYKLFEDMSWYRPSGWVRSVGKVRYVASQ
jgi:hypothetical protein